MDPVDRLRPGVPDHYGVGALVASTLGYPVLILAINGDKVRAMWLRVPDGANYSNLTVGTTSANFIHTCQLWQGELTDEEEALAMKGLLTDA